MLRRPITRFSVLNNVSRVYKKQCSTECFDNKNNNNKSDIKSITTSQEKSNNFTNKFDKFNAFRTNTYNILFSEDAKFADPRGKCSIVIGFLSGSICGGLGGGDASTCVAVAAMGSLAGIMIFEFPFIFITIGLVGISIGIGCVVNKYFVE